MAKTYVSIDIDFWNDEPHLAYEEIDGFLSKLRFNVPVVGVMNHQQLLPYVNKANASKLINVDYHSDAVSVHNLVSLNCGTWVSYVDWSTSGTYIWIRPIKSTSPGSCNPYDKRGWNDGIGWKKSSGLVKRGAKNVFDGIVCLDVVGVGLCLSPAYIENDILESTFRVLLGKHNILYKKGTKHERQSVYRTPPAIYKTE